MEMRSLKIVAIGAMTLLLHTGGMAFAQSGPTGGGSSGKANPSNHATAKRQTHQPQSSCSNFVGTWSWIAGHTIVIKSNGATTSLPEVTGGKWFCKNDKIQITWDNGFIDQISISTDGEHLFGTNQYGSVLSGTRR